jgi:hypothetical protein
MHRVEGWCSSAGRASLPGAMRRLGLLLAVLVLAAIGAFAAIAFLNARDDAGVNTPTSAGPGVPVAQLGGAATTPIDAPAGNVVVLYSDQAQRAQLEALAEDIAGPPSKDLEAAGQAVLVRRDAAADGIVAIANGRGVRVTSPSDPALRAFVEGQLGASAG